MAKARAFADLSPAIRTRGGVVLTGLALVVEFTVGSVSDTLNAIIGRHRLHSRQNEAQPSQGEVTRLLANPRTATPRHWIALSRSSMATATWRDRAHFFAVPARVIQALGEDETE